jgi:hypothetical protein
MAVNISFSGAPFYFFAGLSGVPWQNSLTAQSSILPFAAQVTASIEGPDAGKFGGLKLTAWRPVQRFVPNPQPPELPVGSRQVRAGSVVTFYEMTGTSASGGTPVSLPVDTGGYVEISASALPVREAAQLQQGFNRFAANIAVQGTDWDPISLGLVLNVVDDGLMLNLQFGEWRNPLGPYNFQNFRADPGQSIIEAGPEGSSLIGWYPSNPPKLYPPNQADYPIYFVAGPPAGGPPNGSPILVAGQLYMSPPDLVASWPSPAAVVPPDLMTEASWFAYASVFAYPNAPSVNGSFSVSQSLYNSSLITQVAVQYEIVQA